jgi:hypothetical protein
MEVHYDLHSLDPLIRFINFIIHFFIK